MVITLDMFCSRCGEEYRKVISHNNDEPVPIPNFYCPVCVISLETIVVHKDAKQETSKAS